MLAASGGGQGDNEGEGAAHSQYGPPKSPGAGKPKDPGPGKPKDPGPGNKCGQPKKDKAPKEDKGKNK